MKSVQQIAFSLFITLGAYANAQTQVAVGVKAGGNFNTAQVTDLLDQVTPDFRFASGATAGIVTEISFGDHFALQPEVNWVQKGFAWQESIGVPIGNVDIPIGAKATFKTNYIETPLLAKVKFGTERVQGYAVLGPTFGYALDAKIITRPQLFFELDPIRTKVNLSNLGYERFEVSGTGGLGIQVNLSGVKLFADARYTHGFTQLYNFPVVNEQIKSRGIALSAGLMLDLQTTKPKSKMPLKRPPVRR